MNIEKAALAVKQYLIDLAINDQLPLDINALSEYGIEEAIKSSLPTKREEIIERAGQYLAYDNEVTTAQMIELIAKHDDEKALIDDIEGVSVWEKVEYSFTVEDFLSEIGFTKDFYEVKKKGKKKK